MERCLLKTLTCNGCSIRISFHTPNSSSVIILTKYELFGALSHQSHHDKSCVQICTGLLLLLLSHLSPGILRKHCSHRVTPLLRCILQTLNCPLQYASVWRSLCFTCVLPLKSCFRHLPWKICSQWWSCCFFAPRLPCSVSPLSLCLSCMWANLTFERKYLKVQLKTAYA